MRPSGDELPRLEEVETFLSVADRLHAGVGATNYKQLFAAAALAGYTTALGRLIGLHDFLFPGPGPVSGLSNESKLRLFFNHTQQGELALTDFGYTLRDRLRALTGACDDLRHQAALAWAGGGARAVKIGAPQLIATRLLANALSDPGVLSLASGKLGSRPHFDVVIGNSDRHLVPRLQLGELDCVVAYGPPGGITGGREGDTVATDDIQFVGLGYELKMIIICHPKATVMLRGGKEPADGDTVSPQPRVRRVPKRGPGEPPELHPVYEDLPSVDPHAIDFSRSLLVGLASWRQRDAMLALEDAARRHNNYKEVTWYDEALAYVRMGAGIAVVPSIYIGRQRVKKYRLDARYEADFARTVGFYYDRTRGLSPEVYRFTELLRAYFKAYGTPPRDDVATRPPAFGTPNYPDGMLREFNAGRDFEGEVRRKYPPWPG